MARTRVAATLHVHCRGCEKVHCVDVDDDETGEPEEYVHEIECCASKLAVLTVKIVPWVVDE